ncbi:MAG: class D sortase [Mobilitalea sp.]
MRRRLIRLFAYIYMPFIFTLLGYVLVYFALAPSLEMLQAVGNMVIMQEEPDFSTGLKSIYNSSVTQTSATSASSLSSDGFELAETISEVQEIVPIDEVQFPEYETEYAALSCKRIGMDAPVYWGDTKEVLKAGVGNYIGSFMPGFNKPILLSGHNNTFFKPLQKIEIGDVITYDTNYGTYKFEVSEITILYVTDAIATTKKLLSSEEEKLILYTCYPFETLVGTKMDRFFVFADKISGPVVE